MVQNFFQKKRRFIVSKQGIDIPVVAYDPPFDLQMPKKIKPVLRIFTDLILDKLEGKIIFDKKIHKKALYELSGYVYIQPLILFQLIIGLIFYRLRTLFRITLFFKLRTAEITKNIRKVEHFFFPGQINSLIYENHIPLSFMVFQVDNKILATSFRDFEFAKKAFDKYGFSGISVLAWPSNYFLGYPIRIELDMTQNKRFDRKSLLISTTASVPGYNPGISIKRFYSSALKKKYYEESFHGNPLAINFSGVDNSDITRPIVIIEIGQQYVFKIVSFQESLKFIGLEKTVNIIYPIALLTRDNSNSKDWIKTPQKNVSGFVLGYKNSQPVSISLGSTSLVRMRVNELLPFIDRFCLDEGIDFFAYVHTDDGGAVGDFYTNGKCIQRFSPVWGHCFSSMVGFVEKNKVKSTLQKLEN